MAADLILLKSITQKTERPQSFMQRACELRVSHRACSRIESTPDVGSEGLAQTPRTVFPDALSASRNSNEDPQIRLRLTATIETKWRSLRVARRKPGPTVNASNAFSPKHSTRVDRATRPLPVSFFGCSKQEKPLHRPCLTYLAILTRKQNLHPATSHRTGGGTGFP